MESLRVQFDLGNARKVKVCTWKEEIRIDLREYDADKPTKKGISLNRDQWKRWVQTIETIDEALERGRDYTDHLGGNVNCTVKGYCVDIRQFWTPEKDQVPTRKGLCMRPAEYTKLKETVPDVNRALDESEPCFHQGQLDMLRCSRCNLDDWVNW